MGSVGFQRVSPPDLQHQRYEPLCGAGRLAHVTVALAAGSELHAQLCGINDYNLQLRADLFNVFDRQTGYNYDPFVNGPSFGEPRDYYNPRRLQLAVKFQF